VGLGVVVHAGTRGNRRGLTGGRGAGRDRPDRARQRRGRARLRPIPDRAIAGFGNVSPGSGSVDRGSPTSRLLILDGGEALDGAHAVQCAVDQPVTGERLGLRLPFCIDSGTSGTFGNVTPIAADEPLDPMALTYINHVSLLTGDGEEVTPGVS
jgi:hypothetical protein